MSSGHTGSGGLPSSVCNEAISEYAWELPSVGQVHQAVAGWIQLCVWSSQMSSVS